MKDGYLWGEYAHLFVENNRKLVESFNNIVHNDLRHLKHEHENLHQ